MTTTSRLLTLLSLLQARRDWPGRLLADRLGISDRTVRRDIDRLREMGYSVRAIKGPDGGYRLDAGAELPPLLFDDEQVVALAVALRAATTAGAGVEEAAMRALTTVRQVMPSRLRQRLDGITFTALPRIAPVIASADVLLDISTAIRASQVLRFDYANMRQRDDGELRVPRRVEPHHLVMSNGRWYLVAWDLDRDDWRTFRADKIAPRTPLGARFFPRQVPGRSVHEYVSARFKGSDADNVWPCVGSVILGLPASEVIPFAGDATVEEVGPEQCRLEAGSWSWVALAASFGRFDTTIEGAQPRELAEAFGHLSALYSAAATPAPPLWRAPPL